MKRGILLFYLLFSSILSSQSKDEWGSWIMLYGDNEISKNLDIVTEFRLHHYEIFDVLDNQFYKIGLGYRITPEVSVGAGYVHHYSETRTSISTSENRPYEEIGLKRKIKKLSISNRYRLEHRWINNDGVTDFINRMRYRLQVTHPLGANFYIKVFDEVFLNLEQTIFNQNRLHGGIGYTFSPDFKVELGYVKNHFNTHMDDILRIGILFKTHLRKKTNTL